MAFELKNHFRSKEQMPSVTIMPQDLAKNGSLLTFFLLEYTVLCPPVKSHSIPHGKASLATKFVSITSAPYKKKTTDLIFKTNKEP
jgi:hypothetical protein